MLTLYRPSSTLPLLLKATQTSTRAPSRRASTMPPSRRASRDQVCCVLCVVSHDLVHHQRNTVTVSFPASSIRAGLQSNIFHRCSRCSHCPLRLCKPSSRPTRPPATHSRRHAPTSGPTAREERRAHNRQRLPWHLTHLKACPSWHHLQGCIATSRALEHKD